MEVLIFWAFVALFQNNELHGALFSTQSECELIRVETQNNSTVLAIEDSCREIKLIQKIPSDIPKVGKG